VRTNQAAIPDFDRFWVDGFVEIPQGADERVMLAAFRADPEKNKLAAPDGRIELYFEKIPGFAPQCAWLRLSLVMAPALT
jgi:biotin/methionine sulfoxide reductase